MIVMPTQVIASGKSPKTRYPAAVAPIISRYWKGANDPASERRNASAISTKVIAAISSGEQHSNKSFLKAKYCLARI